MRRGFETANRKLQPRVEHMKLFRGNNKIVLIIPNNVKERLHLGFENMHLHIIVNCIPRRVCVLFALKKNL